jgi:hypothetical protein
MPTVFREDGFRFFFYSNEGDPREPAHIHVARGGAVGKLWLRPFVTVAHAQGMDDKTARRVCAIVLKNRNRIERAWHAHFSP